MIEILGYMMAGSFILGVILLILIASYLRGILTELRKAGYRDREINRHRQSHSNGLVL